MKISEDLRMYKGNLYYPLCFGDGLITYVKVTPADAFVLLFDDSDPESDAHVVTGETAEAAVGMCIEETQNHVVGINNEIVTDDTTVNINLEIENE